MNRKGGAFISIPADPIAILLVFILIVLFFAAVPLVLTSSEVTIKNTSEPLSATLFALDYLRTPVLFHENMVTIGDILALYPAQPLGDVYRLTGEIYRDKDICFSLHVLYGAGSDDGFAYCTTGAIETCGELESCVDSATDITLPLPDGTTRNLRFTFYSL